MLDNVLHTETDSDSFMSLSFSRNQSVTENNFVLWDESFVCARLYLFVFVFIS